LKADLVRRARAEGLDLSSWMLARLAPERRHRFLGLVRALGTRAESISVLAEISDLLNDCGRAELATVTELPPLAKLGELHANQLAAMVETRAACLGIRPPQWVAEVEPLRKPWFASELASLRLYLLSNSPPAFRRRNLFVDSTVGDRR
jgi:hypothetical protein